MRKHTKRITQLSDQMISIEAGGNVIHYFSHLIRANESGNTQFINGAKKLQALLVCTDYL